MASAPAKGWYPDPLGVGQERYWDGTRWTANVKHALPDEQLPPPTEAKAAASKEPDADRAAEPARTIFAQLILADRIQRMPQLEESLGVELSSLNAILFETRRSSKLVVMADVSAKNSAKVPRSVRISASALNENGQVVGEQSRGIGSAELAWRAPIKLEIDPITAVPTRIRVIPSG